MSYYFHAKTAALISTLTHGERMMMVIDEAKLAKLLTAAETKDEADWLAAQEASETPDLIIREDFTARVDALRADPPMQLVPNPDCLVPADAIPISDEDHARLVEELTGENILIAGSDGHPMVAPLLITDDEMRARVRRLRDKALAASDWTQVSDALKPEPRKAWADYRQALRDAPAAFEKALKGLSGELESPFNAADWLPEKPQT